MYIHRVFYTFEEKIFSDLSSRYHLAPLENSLEWWKISTWIQSDEVTYVLVYILDSSKIDSLFSYIQENYLNLEEHIYFWTCRSFWSVDMKSGDIILPHTLIEIPEHWENLNPIFLQNTLGENIDFKKFWLLLNGICCSFSSQEIWGIHILVENYGEGVYDTFSFSLVSNIQKYFSPDSVIVVQSIQDNWEENDNTSFENLYNIVEFIV